MTNLFIGYRVPGLFCITTLLLCLGACDKTEATAPAPVPDVPEEPRPVVPAVTASTQTQGTPDAPASTQTVQAFLDKQRSDISNDPFVLKILRIGLEGGCARGDSEETRPDAAGIRAVIEGTIQYTGSDLLHDARLDGALFIELNDSAHRSEPLLSNPDFLQFEDGRASRVLPAVRGAAPWFKGEERRFQFKTAALNEVYCELVPKKTTVFMALRTTGVIGGEIQWALAVRDISFDEVIGMALRQEVQIEEKNRTEPADAHFCRLDKMLVTRLDGKTEWVPRHRIVNAEALTRAKGPAFPTEATGGNWQVKVAGIRSLKEYGGYAPRGEDQFLAVLDIEVINSSGDEAPLKDLKFRLEVAPGVWGATVPNALEQLDTSEPLSAGSSVTGRLVFSRQRFERPFRLEVTTPDKTVLLLDVFDYKIGPERSPL